MTALHFDLALTPSGWRRDLTVAIEGGVIRSLAPGRADGAESHAIGLPGVVNLHSHAFQRGMSGFAERGGGGRDTFWTWRKAMYRFASSMGPDDLEAVAAQLYVEMLESGFTRVGEFHYLHHDLDGSPYADRAEMAGRIGAACAAVGMNLTLLPVYYRQGGFGGAPAEDGQRRFVTDLDRYHELWSASAAVVARLEGANLGVAPHSLRAVTPGDLRVVAGLAAGGPVHIHAAEQVKEVEDCLAWSGARPVEWLLDNAGVDAGWCLVHATHMTPNETAGLARRGAVAGLCPVTEANLGDGVFDGPGFAAADGRFGIGTDSNVSVGAADELRQLEYAQRLARRARNVLARSGGSTGLALFEAALDGGGRALGQARVGLLEDGAADLVSLDARHPALAGHGSGTLLDAWVFGAAPLVDCVWTRGVKRVSGGRHHGRAAITRRFAAAMARLAA